MRTTTLLATLALLTATIGTPALAASHSHKHQRAQPVSAPADDGYDHGMQTVPHSAAPKQPGHGWQYFSDPATLRAVVISPQGDYYLSRGRGLRWVAAAQTQNQE